LIKIVNSGDLSMNLAKGEVFEIMFNEGLKPEEVIKSKGLKSMNNNQELEDICKQAIAENQKIVEDIKSGKDKAFAAMVGQVMKLSKGQANPVKVNEILKNLIK
jgi:aspartyl-tRNA(Asn)/glutamyl-tRNA(Gln) amidotransferase subunit B